MAKIKVVPNAEYAPKGAEFEVATGETICDALLNNGVDIDHACGKVGACTTCHVHVSQGFDTLNELDENEEDMLDQAWGLQANSRLSCQARVGNEDILVEIPKYSINFVKESA